MITWLKQYFREISLELEDRRLTRLTFEYYNARTRANERIEQAKAAEREKAKANERALGRY